MRIVILTFILFGIVSCKTNKKGFQDSASPMKEKMTEAEQLIDKAIQAHGGDKYEKAHYSFVFRNKNYTFKNNHDSYLYQVVNEKDDERIVDILTNDSFSRTVNGMEITLSEKDGKNFSAGLNSVIYFASLPHKLKDKAVNKDYKGRTNINGQSYQVVKITFSEIGGGQDHDDTFYYWINAKNNMIDYLAYNYKVNKGGVRFRSAYNRRTIGGIIFQDYINYKAEVGTPLAKLPALWEKNELKELSKIETESVKLLN